MIKKQSSEDQLATETVKKKTNQFNLTSNGKIQSIIYDTESITVFLTQI